MWVECEQHGAQAGMHVSPDLSLLLLAKTRLERKGVEIVSLIYCIDQDQNKVIAAYYVSRAFAEEHGLKACVLDMSNNDDACGWEHMLQLACGKCFKETYGGYFDELYRWHPGNKPPHITEPEVAR